MEKFVKLLKPLSLFSLNTKAEATACNATSWADRYSTGLIRDIFSQQNFCDMMKTVSNESSGIWCSYSVWVKLHVEGEKLKMPVNKLLKNSINNTKHCALPYKVVTIPVWDTFSLLRIWSREDTQQIIALLMLLVNTKLPKLIFTSTVWHRRVPMLSSVPCQHLGTPQSLWHHPTTRRHNKNLKEVMTLGAQRKPVLEAAQLLPWKTLSPKLVFPLLSTPWLTRWCLNCPTEGAAVSCTVCHSKPWCFTLCNSASKPLSQLSKRAPNHKALSWEEAAATWHAKTTISY